jgi:oligoendopeptidase F
VHEVYGRLAVSTTVNTADEVAENQFKNFLSDVFPFVMQAQNELNIKLVESGLEPENYQVPLRNMRADIELFREENLPLLSQEGELAMEYDKIAGGQMVEWEGEEVTVIQLIPVSLELDRERRKSAWLKAEDRRREDREAQNDLWRRYMKLRGEIAKNADMPDYRTYMWKNLHRFDYTPEDSIAFDKAIEEVVVPVAERIYQHRKEQLGVDKLRPWDLAVDVRGRDPLHPYEGIDELESTIEAMFSKVDPKLGEYFGIMRQDNMLDLDNRKNKASGGYCAYFPQTKRPFIFMNAVGVHDDVQTLLHEGGHCFHAFEAANLPYVGHDEPPMEFCEVASMAMELIASPYLASEQGGFYSVEDAARARIEHLEGIITFWPYMAVVDSFQHWIYTHHEEATDPAKCDEKWMELWGRFMKGIDFSGLEDYLPNRWRRQSHIFQNPFYYIEYGLAQLGAVQVWANSLKDQAKATQQYRYALALGNTEPLPKLFEAAGARLSFDAPTLKEAVTLIETTLAELS